MFYEVNAKTVRRVHKVLLIELTFIYDLFVFYFVLYICFQRTSLLIKKEHLPFNWFTKDR